MILRFTPNKSELDAFPQISWIDRSHVADLPSSTYSKMSWEEEEADNDESEADTEWSHQGEDDDDDLLKQNRTLLWLCQEGQIHVALQRFDMLVEAGRTTPTGIDQLRKEVFQVGRDKNYPIHEILMGGTSDRNAYALTMAILAFSSKYTLEQRKMLLFAPPSHGRTPLHWAAWGNAAPEILKALVKGNPEALLMRDKRSQGERTPVQILRWYFASREPPNDEDTRIPYLERMTSSWISHRVRLTVHLCANRYFAPGRQKTVLVPFDKNDRGKAIIKPKPWFLISIIGFLLQREMKPLAMRIISYLGCNAKIQPGKKCTTQFSRKRIRSAKA